MVDDKALNGELLFFHIKGRQYGAVNRAEAGWADDEGRQMEPVNDVFQLEKCLFIVAKGADDAATSFDSDVGVTGRYLLPVTEDDFFFNRSFFPAGG